MARLAPSPRARGGREMNGQAPQRFVERNAVLHIPGDTGEGGGQIARMAIALAAVTGTAIRLSRASARSGPSPASLRST
ncbi:MAG: hypothetical protein AMXMBFR72_13270 [Betaproteobacteria bacterium]